MKRDAVLATTSLLSVVLVLLHVSEDIVRGFEPDGLKHIQTYLTMSVWTYGAVALTGKRSGYIVMLLGAMLGSLVSIAHLTGAGMVHGRIANSDGKLLWVFPQILLGVTALVSVALAAQALWELRRAKSTA